ncbi:MAG: SGNH/GDSL hydrolase family protein [Lachnospiraceae bacterium]|nr:SGNH/GDSL hydrolase family protein [Lachnospiraceae bacterium]
MELKGKKIAFLGDSITEGHGVEDLENLYWKQIGRWSGAECFGYGIGGTRLAPQRVPMNEKWDQQFITRVDDMIPDADIVVVFGGTNDFGHGDAPFGELYDNDPETFCGAVHELLTKLITRYPDAQLVVMTPLHRLEENDLVCQEFNFRRVADLETYVDAIIEIAAYYAVPVLDLYRVSGLQPIVPVLQERYMPDGLHPNDAGQRKIAEKLYGFLMSL